MQCLEVEQGGRHHHGNDSTKTGNEYDSIYLHHIGTVLIYIYIYGKRLTCAHKMDSAAHTGF